VNLVTAILLDKGYFDYDFVKENKQLLWEDTVKSHEEIMKTLSMFGIGTKAKEEKPDTMEDIQSYIRKQMEDK
jgi:KaiC/GvpD/RAD55 family RecA-like ATPase